MDSLFYRKQQKTIDLRGTLRRLGRNKRLVALMIVGVPLILYIVFGSRGVVQRVRLQTQKEELQEKIRKAEAETRRLKTESEALDGDKRLIEKNAREKFRMVREGETLYLVDTTR